MDRREYKGNQEEEEEGEIKEGKGGSQKKTDKINKRVKTDVKDKINMVGVKSKACAKALEKMKK